MQWTHALQGIPPISSSGVVPYCTTFQTVIDPSYSVILFQMSQCYRLKYY